MEEQRLGPQQQELYAQALVLVVAVEKMLRMKGGLSVSTEPKLIRRKIVQFGKRMRVDGLEKFSERTVFSAVNFYLDKEKMEAHDAVGALVVFLPVSYIATLLRMMEYPVIEEDDDASVLDGCGTVANLIAGYFVKEMKGLGYIHLEMSHFESYVNTSVDGVEFSPDQEWKYVVDFEINGRKRMVAELTLGHVPRY